MHNTSSGFRRDAEELCALLRYYAALSSSSVSTFRDNLSVPSSRAKNYKKTSLKMGSIIYPETSVQNHDSTLCNISEERGFYQICCFA